MNQTKKKKKKKKKKEKKVNEKSNISSYHNSAVPHYHQHMSQKGFQNLLLLQRSDRYCRPRF